MITGHTMFITCNAEVLNKSRVVDPGVFLKVIKRIICPRGLSCFKNSVQVYNFFQILDDKQTFGNMNIDVKPAGFVITALTIINV